MNDILDKLFGYIQPVQEKGLHLLDGVMQQLAGLVGQIGMSKEDLLTGLLMFSLEITLVLLIIIVYMRFSNARKRRKDVVLAKELKAKIKEYLPGREEKLKAIIADMVPHDEAWAAKSAQEAAGYEKSLYSRILKIILRKDMDGAMGVNNDVERLGDSYQRIVTHLGEGAVGDIGNDGRGGGGSSQADAEKIAELKSIVAKLRKEKQQLQDELEASIKTMDNIVKEYSRIYSDAPHAEGTEHLEKEIAALREKVGIHLGEEEGGKEDPEPEPVSARDETGIGVDAGADIPDVEIDRNEELKELREKTGIEKNE